MRDGGRTDPPDGHIFFVNPVLIISRHQRRRFLLVGLARDRVGAAPKYFISDHGGQFNDDYCDWCAHCGVKPRFGAVGRYGSIALTERFILTLKDEGLLCIIIPFSFEGMRAAVTSFLRWYDAERPHTALDGATPIEIGLSCGDSGWRFPRSCASSGACRPSFPRPGWVARG